MIDRSPMEVITGGEIWKCKREERKNKTFRGKVRQRQNIDFHGADQWFAHFLSSPVVESTIFSPYVKRRNHSARKDDNTFLF